MSYKSIASATVCTVFMSISLNAGAAIIDNGTYTTDTVSGLDWLDLTATPNMSYDDVTAELGAGGAFEGWRYATVTEVIGLFDAFGGDSDYYNGFSTQNNGLFDRIAPLWGDIKCTISVCEPGQGYSFFITENPNIYITGTINIGYISDYYLAASPATQDEVKVLGWYDGSYARYTDTASALVRSAAVVPVPAAVWLFGSGLLGLIGAARRKVRD